MMEAGNKQRQGNMFIHKDRPQSIRTFFTFQPVLCPSSQHRNTRFCMSCPQSDPLGTKGFPLSMCFSILGSLTSLQNTIMPILARMIIRPPLNTSQTSQSDLTVTSSSTRQIECANNARNTWEITKATVESFAVTTALLLIAESRQETSRLMDCHSFEKVDSHR